MIKSVEKQEFQLGEIAYCIDEDYRFFESQVYRVELLRDDTCLYVTNDGEFEFKDINIWVFKTEEDRENKISEMATWY